MMKYNFAMMVLMALAAAGINADTLNLPEGFSSNGIKVYGTTSACETKIIAQGATMIDCWLAVVSQDTEGSDVCEFFEGESCDNVDIGEATKDFSGLFYDGFTLDSDTQASPSATMTVLVKSDPSKDGRRANAQSTDRGYIKFPSGYTCKAGKKHRFPVVGNIGSLKNCEKECEDKGPECVAVAWDSDKNKCFMYKLCNKYKPRKNWKMSRIVPEDSNKFVNFPKGYNCDVSRVADGQPARTFGKCRRLCLQQADCKSFVWVRDDKTCYLKAPCDGGDLVYKDQYHKSASQQPGTDNEYYYIDVPKGYRCNDGGESNPNKLGDEVSDVDSFGDCKNICNYNEECKGLSFNFEKNTCQLYSICTDFNTQFSDESAVVHKVGDWLDMPNGWNLDCSTLETIQMEDCTDSECFEECKSDCEGTTGCTGITYNIDDKRCFLKPEQTNEACTNYEEVSDNRASRMM